MFTLQQVDVLRLLTLTVSVILFFYAQIQYSSRQEFQFEDSRKFATEQAVSEASLARHARVVEQLGKIIGAAELIRWIGQDLVLPSWTDDDQVWVSDEFVDRDTMAEIRRSVASIATALTELHFLFEDDEAAKYLLTSAHNIALAPAAGAPLWLNEAFGETRNEYWLDDPSMTAEISFWLAEGHLDYYSYLLSPLVETVEKLLPMSHGSSLDAALVEQAELSIQKYSALPAAGETVLSSVMSHEEVIPLYKVLLSFPGAREKSPWAGWHRAGLVVNLEAPPEGIDHPLLSLQDYPSDSPQQAATAYTLGASQYCQSRLYESLLGATMRNCSVAEYENSITDKTSPTLQDD